VLFQFYLDPCSGFERHFFSSWTEICEPPFSDHLEADLMKNICDALKLDEEEVYCEEAVTHVLPGLRSALAPERRRLQRGMSDAIYAMLQLVYE
jgi:hypothetical protein